MSTSTAVTKPKPALPADLQARVDENKARNAVIAAIRGTQWGKDCSQEMARAVAQYCRENNLDPVRHVELLGGRIYLTAELYDEKGAHLLRSGEIEPAEPDYINADDRLDKMAASGDAWAIEEQTRRARLRIRYNVPEKAAAAVVQVFRLRSGASVVGVNWCGGVRGNNQYGKPIDPVGDAEPSKTAQTRARRRAWKQVADIIPGYAEIVRPIEATAEIVSRALPVAVVDAPGLPARGTAGAAQQAAHGYTDEPMRRIATSEPEIDEEIRADEQRMLEAEQHTDD